MGELFFRGDDLSVPVYDTFATLMDTNLHFFFTKSLYMLASISNNYSYTLKLSAEFPSLVHLVIMQTISLVGQGDGGPDILLIKSHSSVYSTHAAQTSESSGVS